MMNIVININKKYMEVAEVMLLSLAINNKDSIIVFVLSDDLDDEDIKLMSDTLNKIISIKLVGVTMPENIIVGLKRSISERWPIQVYYRLYSPWLLPDNIDRALYLDSDMIINGNISSLYNINLDQYLYAACEDTVVSNRLGSDNSFYRRLGLENTDIYLNSGLILMNLKKIREKITIKDIERILASDKYELIYPDQDVFNVLAQHNCKIINHRIYNYICIPERWPKKWVQEFLPEVVIYHFGGEKQYKPWNIQYIGKYKDIYWKYANKLPMGNSYKKFCKKNNFYKLWGSIYYLFYKKWIKVFLGKIKRIFLCLIK